MAKRRKSQPPNPDSVHREILEHLAGNPPPRPAPKPVPEPEPEPAPRPRLMLRQLRLVTALHRLETFLVQERKKGTAEVIVVVGRGHQSGPDGPVISPAVQEWCDEHPEFVKSWGFAPADEGGGGALLVRLQTS
jgi:dsDNA-specific endonuclease/ATPase MutS2